MKDFVVVSGIGCFVWIVLLYFFVDIFYIIYGRVIVFVIGVKVGFFDKKVVVISGDGDLVSIGGNYFIYVVRRNIDIMVILVNNMIYGMIGG